MTLVLSRPWNIWWQTRIATLSGRDELAKTKPATRVLLLGLSGWAIGSLVLAACALLWPSSAPVPDFRPSRGPIHGQDVSAIIERPLFAKTRRPGAVPVFVPPAAPPRDRNIVLKGVFLNGSEARAFLTSGTEPQGKWLAVNGVISGWTIISLTPNEVRLKADGETLTVAMHPGGQSVRFPRTAMPILPHPFLSLNLSDRPTRAREIELGLRPDIQQMNAAMLGLMGASTRPTAKAP